MQPEYATIKIQYNMKKLIPTLVLITIAFFLNAQNNYDKFQAYLQKGDTTKQFSLLEKWKKESPKDAELYTSLFNYYFSASKNEIIVINSGQPPKGQNALILKNSTDQIAGFINSQINYEQSNLKLAFESIDKGIKLYPNRLDMRFGKIYALGQIKDWKSFTNEIIKTINYSTTNDNKWAWTFNEQREGGQKMFLSSLQDYQVQLYNTMNDKLLVNMQEISKAVLKHYPKHIESLSNLSIAYLVEKEFDKALSPLLKAEVINPKDFIILNNIAYAYRESGNKEKAISYYEKVIQYGDHQAKTQAEKEIQNLNK